jgi:hypothetical protein
MGISDATCYVQRKKYGGVGPSESPGEGSVVWWYAFDLYIAPNWKMTLYRYNR